MRARDPFVQDLVACELECYECYHNLVARLGGHEGCITEKQVLTGAGHPKCESNRCVGHPPKKRGK